MTREYFKKKLKFSFKNSFAFSVLMISLLFLAWHCPALAAETSENLIDYKEPVSNFNFDFAGTLLKFIISTVICIVILIFVKKYMKQNSFNAYSENIKVIDFASLGYEKNIYVVEIFEHIYILSSGRDGLNKIDEIKDKELISKIRLKSDKNIKGKLFSDYLQKFMPGANTQI
ncbi:MAG: flagellar biosynthetic protein FliO [Candidatus Wallbacteria bacterium]